MKFSLVLLLIFTVSADAADTPTISEQKLYRRCYSQLVQSPVPLKDPVLKAVKEGRTRGVDACIALLNEADLDNQGLLKTNSAPIGTVPQKILRTFF